jgi:hypothetical protein
MSVAYEGAIILTGGIIRVLCTSVYVPPMLYMRNPAAWDRGKAKTAPK